MARSALVYLLTAHRSPVSALAIIDRPPSHKNRPDRFLASDDPAPDEPDLD